MILHGKKYFRGHVSDVFSDKKSWKKDFNIFSSIIAKRGWVVALFLLIAVVGALAVPFSTIEAVSVPLNIKSGQGSVVGEEVLSGTAQVIAGLVANIMVRIANWLFALATYLLDLSIGYSLVGENLKLEGIKAGWTIMRDLGNISFIFILIYISIATILQASGINTKKTLATLILMALLVNFSFFLTGIMVDAGNILALLIYNVMIEPGPIGDQLAEGLRLEGIVEFNENSIFERVLQKLGIGSYEDILIKINGSIVLLVASFVFLSLALLFILRTVVLMFLLVFSPIAFIAAILPGTNSQFKQWLHHLINHSFVAPLTLLLLFVVLKIINSKEITVAIESFTKKDTGTYIASIVGVTQELPDVDIFQIYLLYILIIGLLVGTLVISKRMAGTIASISIKYAGRLPGAAVGAVAWGTRHTIGRGMRRFSESRFMKDRAADSAGWDFAQKRMEGLSSRTFDPRSFRAAGVAASALGTDFGKAARGRDFSAKKVIAEKERRADALSTGPGGEARREAYAQRLRGSVFTRMGLTRGINEAAASKIEKQSKRNAAKRERPKVNRQIKESQQKIDALEKELKETQPIPEREAQITTELVELRTLINARQQRMDELKEAGEASFEDLAEHITSEAEKTRKSGQ